MKYKILLVDDETEILMAYQRNLYKNYSISIAASGAEALDIIRNDNNFAVILTDFSMPGINGIELLTEVKNISPDTTRMLITGYADLSIAISAVNTGKVFRFMTKPISTDNLLLVVRAAVEQYKLINSEKELLNKTLKGSIKILIDILSIGYPEIFSVSTQYRNLAKKIGEELKIPDIWELEIASLLSEIGVSVIPLEIANKLSKDEILDEEEVQIARKIPLYSKELLKNIPRLENVANAIEQQDCNPSNAESDTNTVDSQLKPPIISRILKVVKEYHNESKKGFESNEIIKSMLINSHCYDSKVVAVLGMILSGDKDRHKIKTVMIQKLESGMVLAADVYNEDGLVLLRKGRELSDVHIMRLKMIARSSEIVEPIFVWC
jgi:CheY-like chemotaxis protein